jgi:hypothetical protein
MSGRTMSDEFGGLDATEKAAAEGALNRCRVLADQIHSILRNESPHFVDRVSLADFCAPLSVQPMSSERRVGGRLTTHLLPRYWVRGRGAATDN